MTAVDSIRSIIGALMICPEHWQTVSGIIDHTMVESGTEREVIAICEKISDRKNLETADIIAEISKRQDKDELLTFVTKCAEGTAAVSADAVETFARSVRDTFTAKELASKLLAYSRELSTAGADVNSIISAVKTELEHAVTDNTGSVREFSDCLVEFTGYLQKPHTTAVSSGYDDIDRLTGGFRSGDFDVLAARSGKGKSDFAVSICLNMAKKGQKILYESLEMETVELVERAVSNRASVDSAKIRDKKLSTQDYEDIALAQEEMYDYQFYVDTPPMLTANILEGNIIKYKPSVVVLDNLDLIRPARKCQQKYIEVEETCHALKAIARRTKTCIIALVQLNRSADEHAIPLMSDLYGGSVIEHDASTVAAITQKDGNTKVHIIKARRGMCGEVEMMVTPEYHQWYEVLRE